MTSGKEELKDFCNQRLCSHSHSAEKQFLRKYQPCFPFVYSIENEQEQTSTLQEKTTMSFASSHASGTASGDRESL